MNQQGEQTGSAQAAGNPVEQYAVHILSRLFDILCTCLKYDDTKKDLLNPEFHTHECPYYIKVNPLNLEFTDGTDS